MTRVSRPLICLPLLMSMAAEAAETPLIPSTASKELSLSVAVDVLSKGSTLRRPFVVGETLSAGDRMAIRAVADRNAYVFVMEQGPTGSVTPVVPADGRQGGLRLVAGVQTTIPANGELLELDATSGTEKLYIVASTHPLTMEEAESYGRLSSGEKESPAAALILAGKANAKLSGLRGAPPPPLSPPPPPPHPVKSTERQPLCDGKVHLVAARPGDKKADIVVAQFCFQHGSSTELPPGSQSNK